MKTPNYCGAPTGHEPHDPCPGYPEPLAGQVWQDADPRMIDRYLVITGFDGTHAHAAPITWDNAARTGQRIKDARTTRIRVDRLRPGSKGFRYIATVKKP
ncbi:hypothetical protein [Streptomyces sp. DT18]